MKLFRTLAIVAAMALPLMARQAPISQPVPVGIVIDSIELKDLSTDRVRFEIRSHIIADRNLKIKRVRFEQMHLGSLPIYLNPIDQYLELEKGTPATLPRVPITIYFRDLDSLEPLQQAVREGKATVTGKARIDLDLNFFEKVLSRQWGVHADIPVEITTPVEVPGGAAGRTAAVAALRAAQFALNLGGSALHTLRQSQKSWEEELRSRYVPSLLIAESHYSLRLRSGERADFVVRGLGFRITDDKFVLTDEMVEPWKYDTDVAAALQSHETFLIDDSSDLLVWPSGEALDATTGRSLSGKQIHVEHKSDQTEIAHVPTDDKSMKVRVSKRDADANYAVLRFTRPEDKGVAIQLAPDQILHSQNFDRLTMFRVDDNGKLELVSVPAHRQNNRILLEDSVDDRAFGSVLIAPEGAVGMMQAEQSGMILRTQW